ncbi:MAG: pilus assembly protein N-terminal domain-containing protein [Candidatus Latescibacterota bacterium]
MYPACRTAVLGAVLVGALQAAECAAQETPVPQHRVEVGKSIVLTFPERVLTVCVADQEVADVAAITATEIIGKGTGTTTLAVWDEAQRHQVFEVRVVRNATGQQVLLEVQVGEVNRTSLRELGVDFTYGRDDLVRGRQVRFGSYAGQVRTPSAPLTVGEGVSGLFHLIGPHDELAAIVHALEERGELRLLATPKLLSLSGQQASFLSGGEIPVPVASVTIGSMQQIAIQWKEYGVRLTFTPTVIDSTLVGLQIEPEVSSLDYANAVTLSGFSIPAMLTRRASTAVELHSGEAIFLGGLLAEDQLVSYRRVPVLGCLPLLGGLFSRRDTTRRENELVFVVSPRILGPAAAEPVPALPWQGLEEGAASPRERPSAPPGL